MTLSGEEDPKCHPFLYCQLLKAFYITVCFCSSGVSGSKEMIEVLWVSWLGIDPDYKWGFRQCTLPKIGCGPEDGDGTALGFLDPSLVIHGCHLIPAFADGCMAQLLQGGALVVRQPGQTNDWARYYVNM